MSITFNILSGSICKPYHWHLTSAFCFTEFFWKFFCYLFYFQFTFLCIIIRISTTMVQLFLVYHFILILSEAPIGVLQKLFRGNFPDEFPTISDHSQETSFLDSVIFKVGNSALQACNVRGKRGSFAKFFLPIFEILRRPFLSELSQESFYGGVFSS